MSSRNISPTALKNLTLGTTTLIMMIDGHLVGVCWTLTSPNYLVDLVAHHISHLFLLFVYLDFNLSSKFLLLEPVQIADDLKSRL